MVFCEVSIHGDELWGNLVSLQSENLRILRSALAVKAAGFLRFSQMLIFRIRIIALGALCGLLTQCATLPTRPGNLGGPSVEERNAKVASEPTGNFFYGRRYYIEKTRFWGYIRQPRQPWSRAKLVIVREDKKHCPDRLAENGPAGQRYGYDNNHEYRLRGYYTGQQAYDPNSDQFLAEFMLTGYELADRQPGWLFRPDDRYDPYRITMIPR